MSNKKGPQQPKPLGEKGYHSLDIYMIECNKGLGLRLAFYFSRCELAQIISPYRVLHPHSYLIY